MSSLYIVDSAVIIIDDSMLSSSFTIFRTTIDTCKFLLVNSSGVDGLETC